MAKLSSKLKKLSKQVSKGVKCNCVVELNEQGVAELLKSAEMEKVVKDQADAIAERAGEGYESDTKLLDTRVVASAYTDTFDAMRDNAENNTLLKSINGEYKKC